MHTRQSMFCSNGLLTSAYPLSQTLVTFIPVVDVKVTFVRARLCGQAANKEIRRHCYTTALVPVVGS